jgi:hypothetical protein
LRHPVSGEEKAVVKIPGTGYCKVIDRLNSDAAKFAMKGLTEPEIVLL